MAPDLRIMTKTFLLLSLLLLIPLSSPDIMQVEGFRDHGMRPYYHHSLHKDGISNIRMKIVKRKVLLDVLDYDDTGANRKHDPNNKKGGKN